MTMVSPDSPYRSTLIQIPGVNNFPKSELKVLLTLIHNDFQFLLAEVIKSDIKLMIKFIILGTLGMKKVGEFTGIGSTVKRSSMGRRKM